MVPGLVGRNARDVVLLLRVCCSRSRSKWCVCVACGGCKGDPRCGVSPHTRLLASCALADRRIQNTVPSRLWIFTSPISFWAGRIEKFARLPSEDDAAARQPRRPAAGLPETFRGHRHVVRPLASELRLQ